MLKEFSIDIRSTEEELDFMVALSMSAEGVGAALYVISFLLGLKAAAFAGLGLVCVGVTALLTHLGHPLRFWRVISKTHTTWISRGAIFTGGLIGFGALSLLVPEGNMLGVLFQVVSLVCALVVMLYTGFLFSSMNAIPFWNSSLLPILFLMQSVTSAGILLLGVLPLFGRGLETCPREVSAVMAMLLFCLGLTWVYLRSVSPAQAAQESVRLLTRGRLKRLFVVGAVVAGLVAPMLLVGLSYLIAQGMGIVPGLLAFVGMLLRLCGDMSFRHVMLRAGVYAPVV